jgi:predicted dinucleotide-binding enzyme
MKIAFLGAGDVGAALTKSLVSAGHDIALGVRSVSSEKVRRAMNNHPAINATPVSPGIVKILSGVEG